MIKKRMLFLFNKFPYPPIGGDKLKVYNIAKILSKYFALDLVCLNEGGVGMNKFSKHPFENIFCFNYPAVRFKLNALRGFFSSLPLQTRYYYYDKVQKFIDENLGNYDLVFCYLLRTAPYVIDKKIPKIIDLADSIALAYSRFYPYAHGAWKFLYKIDAARTPSYELKVIEQFDMALLVNEKERDLLVSKGANPDKVSVITNGVGENFFLRDIAAAESREIVFFGRLAAFHNEDAVLYFVEEIWPLIWKQRKDIKFVIIGADPTEKILRLKRNRGIEITGYLEDPYERIAKAMLCVFPMRAATGVQNKILESMAIGKAVIATSIAVEAINGEDSRDFFIADGSLNISRKILELLDNSDLRRQAGINARRLVQDKYTWADYEAKLLPKIEKLLFSTQQKQ